MKTRTFSDNYVGIKLESVSEIMKYSALRNTFSICNDIEYYFDDYVGYENEDGSYEREPTDDEKLERIIGAFNAGESLYATFWLDCGDVVPTKATTLQSDFFVNQEVFFMQDNKICKGHIQDINLSQIYSAANGVPTKIVASYKVCTARNWSGAEYVNLEDDNIFATKEDLVKSLMEESK